MKFKALLAAATVSVATLATPAAAQVQGSIAVVNEPLAIAQTTALQTAYQQISTTYQAQRTTIQERQQQQQTLLQQLDTNNDGNLDENEQRAAQGTPQAQQYAQLEEEIAGLQNQIDRARVYAVEQILRAYIPALQQLVTQNNVQILLAPEAIQFAQPAADMTKKVADAVNASTPSVAAAPPADWQPTRRAVAVFQQVQQILMAAAAQAQAQQQQQQPASSDSRM